MTTTQRIVWTAAEVAAWRAGRKTQHRVPVEPQPPCDCAYVINGAHSHALCYHEPTAPGGKWTADTIVVPPTPTSTDHRLPCPFGKPGDALEVGEPCVVWTYADGTHGGLNPVLYSDHEDYEGICRDAERKAAASHPVWAVGAWVVTPGQSMPAWAVRTRPVVSAVRVERVQDDAHRNAVREGWPGAMKVAPCCPPGKSCHWCGVTKGDLIMATGDGDDAAVEWLAEQWDARHGAGAWDRNDYVWAFDLAALAADRRQP